MSGDITEAIVMHSNKFSNEFNVVDVYDMLRIWVNIKSDVYGYVSDFI